MTEDTASQGHLVSARQITPQIHASILGALRQALALLQGRDVAEPSNETLAGVAQLRVRDWWMVTEEGEQCLEIFLDKGYTQKTGAPGGLEAQTRMTLEECAAFHSFLLETDVLDAFGDSVHIRVGSPGGEPYLRDAIDFRASVGCMIELRTWTKQENRDKFVMLLSEVSETALVLNEGTHAFPIPLGNVRVAQALPFHPQSVTAQKKGKGSRRK